MTSCVDANKDHTCDICGAEVGKHEAAEGSNICEYCGKAVGCAHKYDNDCDKDCNLCGAERVPEEHKYDNACDEDCNVCGEKRTITHAFAEWTETKPATKKEAGEKTRTCTVCGAVETEEIPQLEGGFSFIWIIVIILVVLALGCVFFRFII